MTENIKNGKYRDPRNNDLTGNNLSVLLGSIEACDIAIDAVNVFAKYETPEGAEVASA